MAKHIVLGAGNLGIDLHHALQQKGEKVEIVSSHLSSIGGRFFHYFGGATGGTGNLGIGLTINEIRQGNFDHIWCTIGAGSVEGAKQDFAPYLDLHVRLPMELFQKTKAKVHLFSTEYLCATDPAFNLYAFSKSIMEMAAIKAFKDRVQIYRVGSLYGVHKPLKTFPGKLMQRGIETMAEEVLLPTNECVPTPTAWLAKELVAALGKVQKSITWPCPNGTGSPLAWAALAFPHANTRAGLPDRDRPEVLQMHGSAGIPTWIYLWNEYGPAVLEAARKELGK